MQILIAEDDSDTATMYRRFLEGKRNHHVIIANGGLDCLTFYHEKLQNITSEISASLQGRPFDVIILDYKMADMNGLEVAKEILGINPHQRIIFASAYVKQTVLDSVKQLNQPVESLQKPFGEEQLIYAVEKKE
jgi:CheY-like chemotaxis protein